MAVTSVVSTSADLVGRHVLALPAQTPVDELAGAWFAAAGWVREPVTAAAAAARAQPLTGARFRGVVVPADPEPGELRLTPGATLVGPVDLDAADAQELGVPVSALALYGLRAEDAVDPQVLHWLERAARRAGGAVLPANRASVVVPDPHASVDLALFTPHHLPVATALALVRSVAVRTTVSREPATAGDGPAAYQLRCGFEYDGALAVDVERVASLPVALSRLDWREYGPFAVSVRWRPTQPEELELEPPSPMHVIARERVAPVVARVVAAVRRSVGGTVVDDAGFVVDATELAVRAARDR